MPDDCLEEIQRHKFYLAFENSLCVGYITEKYWENSLERGLVPVVLGGAPYSPEQAIPGSFINAADVDSIKDLADYLKYLDKNDTAYTGLVLRLAASRMLNRQRGTGHPPRGGSSTQKKVPSIF